MEIKNGASIIGLRSEILLAYMIAEVVYEKYFAECVITEGTGGVDGKASLHYVGSAIDLRTRDFDEGVAEIVASEIRVKLNEQYDVVLESDHIHIEFQPK